MAAAVGTATISTAETVDVVAAAAARDDVDADRILLVGFSNGGTTTLLSMLDGYQPKGVPSDRRFRAAVAFYPWCRGAIEAPHARLSGPTLIVIGAEDDWTPAAPCRDAAARYDGPHRLDARVIAGAYHSFDMFRWRGRPVGSRTYLGHRLEPSGRAVAEAEAAIGSFLMEEGLPSGP